MMYRAIAAIVLIFAVSGCRRADRCESLERLKNADPAADAKTALAHGDNHLLMLGGLFGTVPGAGPSSRPAVMIQGTSDVTTVSCMALRPVAEVYARRYNLTIIGAKAR